MPYKNHIYFFSPSRRFYIVILGNGYAETLVYGDLICIKLNHLDISERLCFYALVKKKKYSLCFGVQHGFCNKFLNFLRNSIMRPSDSEVYVLVLR